MIPVAQAVHPAMTATVRRAQAGYWPRQGLARRGLVERLMASGAPLAVVSAPAGYGKTTLVKQWAARDERPFAWVKLTVEDNCPDALAEHLTRSLLLAGVLGERRTRPSVTLARRRGGAPQTDLDATLTISGPVVIVVDDAEELVAAPALAVLERLLGQLPAGSRLAVSGRTKPGLRLARLRAADLVQEMGANELALSPEEGARLLEAAGVCLSPRAAASLAERAEGWPAGLALAAKSLQLRADPELDARHFDGDDRAVAEYFADVLHELDPALVAFLLETSVLDRFCAPLCDAVRQRQGSSRAINGLEKANLFMVPLDHTGEWYRYHHLFATFLQCERRRHLGDDDATLHVRASHWLEEHGEYDGAVRHAYAAGDLERYEKLVWLATPGYINNGHINDLATWLQLPRMDQVLSSPAISLAAAWVKLGLNGGETGPLIANLPRLPTGRLPDGMDLAAALSLLRATNAGHGLAQALAGAASAYDAIADNSPWKAFACLFAGTWSRLHGRPGEGVAMLKEGYQRAALTMPALAARCLVQLAWLAMDNSDWGQAEPYAHRARAALEPAGAGRPVDRFAVEATSVFLATRSGQLVTQSGNFPASHGHVQAALKAALKEVAADDLSALTTIEAEVIAARTLVLLSDHAGARRLLVQAREQSARVPETGILAGKIAEAERLVDQAYTASPVPDPLTPAEMRVLRYLPTYMTFAEISRELIVSRTTVKTQALAVYRKLGVNSRSDAVRKACQQGLLTA